MARATLSQDRSRQRRDALLDAAIALFAEGGEHAITHRAVAARAGVPPATTAYYFASIETLVEEALSRHMDQWLHDLRAITSTRPLPGLDDRSAVDLVAAAFAVRTPAVVQLQLSVFLAATRSDTLRPKAAEALTEVEALTTRIMRRHGLPEPEQVARSVVAVVTGSAFGRLTGRHDDRAEAAALFRSLRAVLVAAAMDEDEVAARLRTLAPKSRHGP